jgi:hypothetical protein
MAAKVAMAANMTAIPINIGKLLVRNGRPVRENTKGRMGRMQGLRMVKIPPR